MSVKKFYDHIAKDYDRLRFNRKYRVNIDLIEKNFVLKSAKKRHILEVGVGTGRFMKLLVSRCERLTVVDFSESMLKTAGKKLTEEERSRVNFIKMDIFDLGKLSSYGELDTIVCMRVLPHIKDQEKALQILTNGIKKDGNIIFDFWNRYSLYYLGKKYFGKKSKVYTKFTSFNEAKRIIKRAGLVVQDNLSWDVPWVFSRTIHRMRQLLFKNFGYGIIFNCVKKEK